jgi:succinate dehydrogenase / fumarate reductase, cytochrome b subunit
MHRNPSRPLSPHLTIWRWGPHMLVSILHRVTGVGLATIGAAVLVWWLLAIAGGKESYEYLAGWAKHWLGIAILVGLTWAFFQHLFSGLRHFVMDIGAGYELGANKFWAVMTLAASVLLTAFFWFYVVTMR